MEGNITADLIHLTDDIAENDRTTCMMRNLPNKYTRDSLLSLLADHGFQAIDFFYVPFDFRSKSNMGYAFVNFVEPHMAKRFMEHFSGFCDWNFKSVKKCDITWSRPFQGLAAHIDRYRNSPMMHESVPAKFKPCIFKSDGELFPFPKPVRRIDPPKLRRTKRSETS